MTTESTTTEQPGQAGEQEDVKALIAAAVSEATEGLKRKNSEVILDNKKLKEQLAKFDGIDVDAMGAMLKRFADDEEAGLIKAGKIDEVLAKRTERMQQDFAKQLKAKDDMLTRKEQAVRKLADRALSEAIVKAASKAGALPDALDDIVLRAKASGWGVNDDGDVVALRDGEVVLGKDGKTPLSPMEWAESLRESAAHLWPKAQGSGASGGGSGGAGAKTITREHFAKLDPAAQMAAVKGGAQVVD